MKVLLINKFLFPKGGDAISTLNTGLLLKSKGHEVAFWGMQHENNETFPNKEYFVNNVDFNNEDSSVMNKIKSTANILYSIEAKKKLNNFLKNYQPDIAHLNNFAHQISPSILHVLQKYKIPCVMTMRDYKIVCPIYTMTLKGKPCELCKNGKFYHCLINKCTKGSLLKSSVNTIEMYLHHSIFHLYEYIDTYISPSQFLADKCIDMGLKRAIEVLPNFVKIDSFKPQYTASENSILYLGRLSHEKGIQTLVKACRDLAVTLKFIGDGPLLDSLKSQEKQQSNIKVMGYLSGEALHNEIRNSICVVVPSEWYENNPRSVIESFALGKPVVGADIGGIPELVFHNKTGLLFQSGNSKELRKCLVHLIENPAHLESMGKAARMFVEEKLTSKNHYQHLMSIYQSTIDRNHVKKMTKKMTKK